MPTKKNKTIEVKGTVITITGEKQDDYISLTDIARYKDVKRTDYIIQNWMRNRNTVEFLGIWEKIYNPNFKPLEFEGFKNRAGLNSFVLTPKQWIEKTKATGIVSKAGRYGGTYAHKDIAFEFATWISVEFKLYLIKEFQRLKENENNRLNIEWNVKRLLSKINYHLQTDTVQKHIIPIKNYQKDKEWLIYAEEADLLNVALFGCTAKDWREANPELAKTMNVRDMASINELIILSNIESMNAILIRKGSKKEERFTQLSEIAHYQLQVLNQKETKKTTEKNEQAEQRCKKTTVRNALKPIKEKVMQFLDHISLKQYNTFGVEAKARYFVTISDVTELESIIFNLKPAEVRHLIIGGGSNLLFTQDFDGWIFHNDIKGIEIREETNKQIFVKAGGGECWSDFVDFTVEKGWGGLENLSLIPGTVGAAPVQNIGAYGVEQQEAFVSLEACNLITGKTCTFNKLECDFDYRHSIFKGFEKGKWFVLNVTYGLEKIPKPNISYEPLRKVFDGTPAEQITVKAVSEAVKSIRRSKLPDTSELGNAGSFFKNPVVLHEKFLWLQQHFPDMPFYQVENNKIKIPAGWLIEQSGWKGKRIGNTGVHHQQALVIVNFGGATGQEILQLSKTIQKEVMKKFDIMMETEVMIL